MTSSQHAPAMITGHQLSAMRREAEAVFERMWKFVLPDDGTEIAVVTMAGSYAWLARKLAIPEDRCRFHRFDAATCRRTMEICKRVINGLEKHGRGSGH